MLIRTLYDGAAAPALAVGYRWWGRRDERAARFFAIREGMFARLEAAGVRGAVLFHVASAGELLQARPVLAAVKARAASPALALSYTSPSAEGKALRELTADLVTPSPLDRREPVRRFLDLIAPRLIVFSTYDLWPNLVWQAADRDIPLVLINASLPAGAGRLGFPARTFYRTVYDRLAAVGAISEADGRRHRKLGVPPERLSVTGNCRVDETRARCGAVRDNDPDLAPAPAGEFVLIAGSTWPEDQRCLLPALDVLLRRHDRFAVMIAPHQPTPTHVAEVEEFFAARGHATERYTALRERGAKPSARVVVVDTVGVLYKLYRRGQAAYVGGSFRQGIHSVLEPAGMGLPVVFGPRHRNSAEALAMLEPGAAVTVNDEAGLAAELESLITSPERRGRMACAALAFIERNAGATERTLQVLARWLP